MEFENFRYAATLLLVPLLALIAALAIVRRGRALRGLGEGAVLQAIVPRGVRDTGVLLSLIGGCLALAVLRPQYGAQWIERPVSGVDLIVALDVSDSMRTEDLPPNRLERAKRETIDLLKRLRGDRVGLVVFSGVSFLELPLTRDYNTFQLFLSAVQPDLVPIKGTNIASALNRSMDALTRGKGTREAMGEEIGEEGAAQRKIENSSRKRAILLITDGESFDGDLEAAKRRAAEAGVNVFILGVGTVQGGPIPVGAGYKRDRGGMVISRLKPEALRELAAKTGGVYVQAVSNDEDIATLYDRGIKPLLQGQTQTVSRKRVATEVFQLPLLFGVLLLVWRRIRARGPVLGGVLGGVLVVVACGALYPNTVAAQSVEREGREAERAYEAGEFERALELFQQRDEPRFRAGRGAALYRLGRYEEAAEEFARAAEGAKSEKQRAEWLYNGGNALLQLQKPEAAIKQYEQSLAREPRDRQARENLAYAKALLEKQQQSKERSNQESQQQQPKQSSSNSNQSSSGAEKPQPNNQGGEDNSKPRDEASSPKNNESKNDQQQSEPQPLNPEQREEKQQPQHDKEPDKEQPEKNRQDKEQQGRNQQGKNQPVEKPQDQQSGETQGAQEPRGEAKENRGEEESTAQQQEGGQQNSNQQDAKQIKPSESEQFSEALLRGLQEDRSALLQYRRKKALEERERDASRSTGKDW